MLFTSSSPIGAWYFSAATQSKVCISSSAMIPLAARVAKILLQSRKCNSASYSDWVIAIGKLSFPTFPHELTLRGNLTPPAHNYESSRFGLGYAEIFKCSLFIQQNVLELAKSLCWNLCIGRPSSLVNQRMTLISKQEPRNLFIRYAIIKLRQRFWTCLPLDPAQTIERILKSSGSEEEDYTEKVSESFGKFWNGRKKQRNGNKFHRLLLSFLSSLSRCIKIEPTKQCTMSSKHGALYPWAVDLPVKTYRLLTISLFCVFSSLFRITAERTNWIDLDVTRASCAITWSSPT